MKLGIKVAPRQDSFDDLKRANAQFAEVWYHANKPDDYTELFAYLNIHAPKSGLHFWGSLPDGSLATIAYPDTDVVNKSMRMIQDTIDIAATNHFSYVNIHPGTRVLVAMDFETERFTIKSPYADINQAESTFLENAIKLNDYAIKRGVLLTVETVPRFSAQGWRTNSDRAHPVDIGDMPISTIHKAAENGIAIANDFSHTVASIITTDIPTLRNHLYQTTAKLAPFTRLIHIGFLFPPFNGTESHDSLENPIFDTNQAIPNKSQCIELLKSFQNRNDVYALVEPKSDHVRNFFLAKQLLEQAGVAS